MPGARATVKGQPADAATDGRLGLLFWFCSRRVLRYFEVNVTGTPFHRTDPSSWPWFVYVWLALFLAGWPKPLWRWIKRQRASIWPTDSREIQTASVSESKRFFISTTPSGGSQTYVAALCSCDQLDEEVGLWQNRACRALGTTSLQSLFKKIFRIREESERCRFRKWIFSVTRDPG